MTSQLITKNDQTELSLNGKTVTLKILDHTGDTNLQLELDAAVEEIKNQHFNYGKWVYAGTQHFQFTASGLDDTVAILEDSIRLKSMLDASDAPMVIMTGDLQGGLI